MPTTKEILSTVRTLEISTRRLVDGLLQGAYHSVFKGRGIEFSEVREYAYGDDVRAIDWNVTARFNHPYVKEFIEERDLNVVILFDVSSSAHFGSTKEKKDAAIELAASLMFAALRNNDNIGLLLFSDYPERFIPLRKGKRHVLKLIRELICYQPLHRMSDLHSTLVFTSKVLKKRSIIFIISDFLLPETYQKPLRILKGRHDLICVSMSDIREHELPDIGFVELEDAETGEQMLIDTSQEEFRSTYAKLVKRRNSQFMRMMRSLGVDTIQLRSDEPLEVPVRRFFCMRMKRQWHS
jgi:uncharacterized protein (DUF58 family)